MTKKKFKHIILISLDNLRADCVSASSSAYNFRNKYNILNKLKCTELDRLIEKSVYYDHCLSAAPYTSASHATIFTGFWPAKHGVYEFFNRKLKKPTIFEYAKECGYTTILQTDFPVILGKHIGFNKGIDHYFIEDEKKAFEKLVESTKSNQKTMSLFHFGGIHYPYGFHTYKFGGEDYVRKVEFLEKKYNIKPGSISTDKHDESYRSDFDKQLLSRYKAIIMKLYDDGLYDDLFSLYVEGINYFFEYRFNKFLGEIKKFVERENALLVIFADHGEGWDANCYGHYNSISHEVLHVPLCFYARGIKKWKGDTFVRLLDVTPTLMQFLEGVKAKNRMDGQALHIFNPVSDKSRNFSVAQFWHHGDREKFIKFRDRILKKNKIVRPMRTHLVSETIYDGVYKLLINYDKKDKLLKEQFLKRKGWDFFESKSGPKKQILQRNLKQYNKKFKSVEKSVELSITQQLKEHLNNMGYDV